MYNHPWFRPLRASFVGVVQKCIGHYHYTELYSPLINFHILFLWILKKMGNISLFLHPTRLQHCVSKRGS